MNLVSVRYDASGQNLSSQSVLAADRHLISSVCCDKRQSGHDDIVRVSVRNDRYRDVALDLVGSRCVMAAVARIRACLVDDDRRPRLANSVQSVVSSGSCPPGFNPNETVSRTAHAVHVPPVTRATGAKPMPVVSHKTCNSDGTASMREIAAISRAIASGSSLECGRAAVGLRCVLPPIRARTSCSS